MRGSLAAQALPVDTRYCRATPLHWFLHVAHLIPIVFAWLLAAVWTARILDALRGLRTVANISGPAWDAFPEYPPRVSIIVPARNEAEQVESCLRSLLALDYPDFEIIAVDDRSEDATGAIMDRLRAASGGRLKVIHVAELPPRWLGKTHAMWTAGEQATGEFLLFTDGDIVFRPDALRRAMLYVEREGADHLVLYPQVVMNSVGERMMISFFQTMFLFGHRAWKVADPEARDHIGVGAFNLVRRTAYRALGTYQALRLEVIDDMKLGEAIKRHRFAQRNVFGDDLISLRWASGAFGVVGNLTKNFFSLMRYRWYLSALAICGIAWLNIAPFLGAIFSHYSARVAYGISVAMIWLAYWGMQRISRVPAYYFVLHPVGAVLLCYTIARSTALALWNNGVTWRGTKYPLSELRNPRD